jgi:hypothetical protein
MSDSNKHRYEYLGTGKALNFLPIEMLLLVVQLVTDAVYLNKRPLQLHAEGSFLVAK